MIKRKKIINCHKVINLNSYDCFKKISKNLKSYLIDVRTRPEWEFVGVPDLSAINNSTIFISWQEYPEMNINKNFEKHVTQKNIKKNDYIFLICRSGQRSLKAAEYLSSLGYKHCFNISDGFEGNKNNTSHRSKIRGWKFNNLPWKQ